jgi:hypothetical protein
MYEKDGTTSVGHNLSSNGGYNSDMGVLLRTPLVLVHYA